MKKDKIDRRALILGLLASVGYLSLNQVKLHAFDKKFPFKILKFKREEIFSKWEELRSQNIVPIIIGAEKNINLLREGYQFASRDYDVLPDVIIRKADKLKHPDSLVAKRKQDNLNACINLKKNLKNATPDMVVVDKNGNIVQIPEKTIKDTILKECEDEIKNNSNKFPKELPSKDWPKKTEVGEKANRMIEAIFEPKENDQLMLLLETESWTDVPAHLRLGGWNSNPKAEYHIAAWRDRYQAELVGMSHDTLVIRVGRRPQSRQEAYELAVEHYYYCSDIVNQGIGSVEKLAAWLTVTDAWFFWWD